jgi:hypothetical protein
MASKTLVSLWSKRRYKPNYRHENLTNNKKYRIQAKQTNHESLALKLLGVTRHFAGQTDRIEIITQHEHLTRKYPLKNIRR